MLKIAALTLAVVLFLEGSPTTKGGCQDAVRSATHFSYAKYRDMRHTVALLPQKGSMRPPDSSSVPVQGIEPLTGIDLMPEQREQFNTLVHDPVAAADMDSSVARGERKFMKTCMPCHGKTMLGDGTVAPKFMPPPDLLAQTTRERSDGYIYSYIRHGGVVMPSYGAQVTAVEAWNLIHYVRHMQKATPR